MKKLFHIMTAALLVAGALLTTACTNDDIAADDNATKTVTFTATLAPKGGNDATRAITTGTDDKDKETLITAWKAGEKIAVYYQKTDDSYAKATATVGTPNDDGSAPITAELTGAMNGGTVKYVYPATLMNKYGTVRWSDLCLKQKGYLTTPESGSGSGIGQSEVNPSTVNTISSDFDLATGTGTIVEEGGDRKSVV